MVVSWAGLLAASVRPLPVLVLSELLLSVVAVVGAWILADDLAVERDQELASLKVRGASGVQVGVVVAAQLAPVAAGAALLGAGAGLAVVHRVLPGGSSARLAGAAAATVLVVVLAVVGFAAASGLRGVCTVRKSDGVVPDPARAQRARATRTVVEVGAAMLGLVALLRMSGPAAASAPDPAEDLLVVAGPVLLLGAGAVIAARVPPLLGAATSVLARRSRGAGWVVVRASWSRRLPWPLTTLMVLAVAGLVTVPALAATRTAAQQDAAVLVAGADVRVVTGRSATAPRAVEAFADGAALAALPAIAQVAPGVRQEVRAAGAVDLLALDTQSAAQALSALPDRVFPGVWSADVAELRRVVPKVTAWPLPPGTGQLVAQVRADRPMNPPPGNRAGREEVEVIALLAGPGGTGAAVALGPVPIGDGMTELRAALPPQAPDLALVGLDVLVPAGPPAAAEVVVAVESLTAAPVPLAPPQVEWRVGPVTVPAGQERPDPELSTGEAGGLTLTVAFPGGPSALAQVRLLLGNPPATLAAVPVLLTRIVADELGVTTGEVVELGRPGQDLPVEVVAVIDALPGGGQHQRVALAEVGVLTAFDLVTGRTLPAPNEWWLELTKPVPVGVIEQVLADTPQVSVIDRATLEGRQAPPEVTAGARVALTVASGAILVVAVLGGAAAAHSIAGRRREYALLRAVGAGRRELLIPLLLEWMLLALGAVVLGVLVAVLAAPTLIPALLPDTDSPSAGLPPRVVLPGLPIAAVAGGALVVLLVAAAVGVAAARPVRQAAVVRLGEDP